MVRSPYSARHGARKQQYIRKLNRFGSAPRAEFATTSTSPLALHSNTYSLLYTAIMVSVLMSQRGRTAHQRSSRRRQRGSPSPLRRPMRT